MKTAKVKIVQINDHEFKLVYKTNWILKNKYIWEGTYYNLLGNEGIDLALEEIRKKYKIIEIRWEVFDEKNKKQTIIQKAEGRITNYILNE